MGLGTRIRRRNVRWGTPVEGEMEVTEWEPEQAVAFVVRDANMEAHGCTSFEALGPDRTVLTVVTDFPGLDESKVAFVTGLMERSVGNVKALVESETQPRTQAWGFPLMQRPLVRPEEVPDPAQRLGRWQGAVERQPAHSADQAQ